MAGSERGTVAKVIGNRTAPMWIVLTMTRSGSALGLTCINLWKFAIFPTHNPTVYKVVFESPWRRLHLSVFAGAEGEKRNARRTEMAIL